MAPAPPTVHIVSAVRSPVGTFHGPLSSLTAVELGSKVISGQHPAKQCATHAGLLPKTVCTSINKVCSSGLKAITLGAQTVLLGHADVVVAGGVESMSNAPNYIPAPQPDIKNANGIGKRTTPALSANQQQQYIVNGVLRDGLRDAYGRQEHMGMKGEKCASSYKISREEQDEWTVESYERAIKAHNEGWFRDEIVPITVTLKDEAKTSFVAAKDDELEKFSPSKIQTLQPAFIPRGKGTITAANSSSLSDGAAAVVLVSSSYLTSIPSHLPTPQSLGQIISWADVSLEPSKFTIAPSKAIPLALERANLDINSIDAFEINDAFAVGTIAICKILNLDKNKVNFHGGSVALGHPLGASGARIVVTLLGVLRRIGGRYGVVAICNGGGEGSAIVIENLVFENK